MFMPYVNNKGADQPAHPRSLISVFVVRCLDNIIPLIFCIRNFKPLASLCSWAGRFESYLVANVFLWCGSHAYCRLEQTSQGKQCTIMILNFQTDRSGQTVQTQIRLFLWSGSTLFAIPSASFRSINSMVKRRCSNFGVITANFSDVQMFANRNFYKKIKTYTRHPLNWKMTHSTDKDGTVHLANIG